jgi:hypothetical protein
MTFSTFRSTHTLYLPLTVLRIPTSVRLFFIQRRGQERLWSKSRVAIV